MMPQLLQWIDADTMGKIALLMFFVVFAGVVAYAWTRPAAQVKNWSRLPLGDDPAQGPLRHTWFPAE